MYTRSGQLQLMADVLQDHVTEVVQFDYFPVFRVELVQQLLEMCDSFSGDAGILYAEPPAFGFLFADSLRRIDHMYHSIKI